MTGHGEIIKRLRAEIESVKKENSMLYERLADCALRETKLTLEVKVLRDVLDSLKHEVGQKCFCDISIGNPMMRGHSKACDAAMGVLRGAGE